MKKLSKAEWEALGADEQAKYKVNPQNEDEYLLIAQPAPVPDGDDEGKSTLTKAQQAIVDARVKDEVKAAVDAALAEAAEKQRKKEEEENGEFEKLYREQLAKTEALETENKMLAEIVDAEIEARAAELSDDLKPLYEMVGSSRTARLTFLQKAGTVKSLGAPPPPTPRPGKQDKEEWETEILQSRLNSGVYTV